MTGVEVVASWLTPTVLFCVLNLMIGTILFRSNLRSHQKTQHKLGENDDVQPHQLLRVPSQLFKRVKSINLSRYRSSEQPDTTHYTEPAQEQEVHQHEQHDPTHYTEPAQEQEVHQHEQPDPTHYTEPGQEQEVHQPEPEHHVTRTKSETLTKTLRAARVLKKSLSEKVAPKEVVEEEEEEDQRRPATTREKTARLSGGDEEVDGKADDFIYKFRQQLKLQRLDSILRYKEILNRGLGR